MATVAYFTQRHIKCISRLPGRALQAAVTADKTATWTVPSHVARTNNQLQRIRSSVESTIGEIRESVGHIVWLVAANFSDKHANVRTSHPLLAS